MAPVGNTTSNQSNHIIQPGRNSERDSAATPHDSAATPREADATSRDGIARALATTLPFWPNLTELQKTQLASATRPLAARAGDRVQGGGSGCAGVVVALAGSLRAYMPSETGKEITLFRVETGETCVLAASCILPMITFDIALDAAEDIEALIIDPRFFSRLSQENVAVEAYLYRQTAQRFSDCMWVMQQVLFSSFDTRLATFLLDESARTGSARLTVTHDEIARHLGSAREVVSRMLKYFEREGLVALSRGAVEVLDRKRLLARASD